jgi:alpha/beta hydrolase fold
MAGQQREALPRCRTAPAVRVSLWALFALFGFDSVALSHVDPWPAPARDGVPVGSMELRPCLSAPALCGSLDRPLDPTGAIPGRISIHFEYYPHSGPDKPLGPLVATEGGPGYPATLSRDDYLALFKPLRRRHDFLLMDNRGTGQSGAIDCHELQTAEKWTVELIGACGKSLGSRAPLYSTAYAADDLAAILEALGIRRIDLYGDSYGTYFEHVILNQVRWTEDLAVSGTTDIPVARAGTVRAALHLTTADGVTGDLNVEWPEGIVGSGTRIRGTFGGARVTAQCPAP